MDAVEIADLAQIGLQSFVDLLRDLVRLTLELFRLVLGQLRHRRLGGVPVARTILVKIGRCGGEPSKRVAENGRRLAGHHAAEFDAPVLNATIGCRSGWRGPQVDRARHTAARRELAEVWHLAVEAQRQRVRAVHIFLDHRHPVVREVARR